MRAWPALLDTAEAAARTGLRVTVVQAASHDAAFDRQGVAFHFLRELTVLEGALSAHQWARLPSARFRGLLRSLQPDLLHLHSLSFPLAARPLGRALPRVPLLVQDHSDRPPPRWRRALHRWGLSRIDGAAFTARALAHPLTAAGVLPRGIPIFEILETSTRFAPGDTDAARAATGLYGNPCMVWVGRLNRDKDPMTVLTAVALAAQRLPDLHLWCCYTEAPLLPQVRERLAADPGLARRVHLLGAVPHESVQELCRAADFFVSASQREGSSFALLEALACGTTPLVADIPTARRITDNGAVGALFPPRDAAALASAILRFAARQPAELRAAARAHFERRLSFEALGRQLRSAYTSLVRACASA
ncbi:MAG: glycosyltransferase family 4 protein [Gemmatimonadetes bacterium]|nr:glycosyltransferase family 4 protein [Gemmatimonadota bacterium]